MATSAVTCAVVPWPSVTMTMTAATPMTMPSTVRIERSALRRIVRTESLSGLVEHQAASAAGAVICDPAVEEADDAVGVGRHVRLVGDHDDGDALVAVEAR